MPAHPFPPWLRAYIAAVRTAPDSGTFKKDPEDAWHEEMFSGMDDCMCESPSDSLVVVFGDGRTERYEMYCSTTSRVRPDTTRKLRLDDISRHMLVSRWDALRLQYCPNPYGCGDVPRSYWHTGIRRLVDSTWVKAYMDPRHLADSLKVLIERVRDPDPMVEILVTLQVRDRVTERITVDSVGARYAELADTLAARGLTERVPLADGRHQFRLIAFNFFLEK